MESLGNDRWRGVFTVSQIGVYRYTVMAWVDHFTSWRRALAKKVEADQDVAIDLLIGAELVQRASMRASGAAAQQLRDGPAYCGRMVGGGGEGPGRPR